MVLNEAFFLWSNNNPQRGSETRAEQALKLNRIAASGHLFFDLKVDERDTKTKAIMQTKRHIMESIKNISSTNIRKITLAR